MTDEAQHRLLRWFGYAVLIITAIMASRLGLRAFLIAELAAIGGVAVAIGSEDQ